MEHDDDRIPDADERLVQRYVDGELSDTDVDELERRIDEDPALRAQAEAATGLESFFAAAREDTPGRLGVGFGDRLWTKVEQEESNREAQGMLGMLKSLTVAAACVLLLLGILALASRHPTKGPLSASDERQEVERTLKALDLRADRDEERALRAEALRKSGAGTQGTPTIGRPR